MLDLTGDGGSGIVCNKGGLIMRTVAAFLCFVSIAVAADKKEPVLSIAQKKAIAKYDHLPDEWREKAVEAWKSEFKNPAVNKVLLLKNEPPFYPPIMGEKDLNLHSWGSLKKVNIDQVLGSTSAIGKIGETAFYINGLGMKDITDGDTVSFGRPCHVTGTKTYKTVVGGTKTVYVIEPIHRVENDDKKSAKK